MRKRFMRLMLALGVILPLMYACHNDDEGVTPTPTPETPDASPPPPVEEDFTIVGPITAREDLSSLETTLTAVQLIESLREEGPFTAFVPNNEAFTALLNAQKVESVDALVKKLGVDAISDILQAHVVNKSISSDVMRDKDVFTTLSGATLTVTVDRGDLRINGAKIIETDLVTENGIVHVIDSVVNLSAANDGSNGFTVTIENVSNNKRFFQHGVFNTPIDGTEGPAAPGQTYEFSFNAGPTITADQRTRISFAAKLTGTFDQFVATDQNGVTLYDEVGQPITGDITGQVKVYDAGTKDEAGVDVTGPSPVREVGPATGSVTVTISNVGTLFTVRITNAQTEGGISPGIYGVHTVDTPLFGTTRSAGSDGLEALAEEGDPTVLSATMANNEGFIVPLSPGVFAVHGAETFPVLNEGVADRGQGLESMAEDGVPDALAATLAGNAALKASGIFDTPVGGNAPAAIGPGQSYSFTITETVPGDYLSIVTMMVQSNDIVYSTPDEGIALFDAKGRPFNGNASRLMVAYDAGTELNEYPGAGLNQPIRQAAPNTGEADPDNRVRRVTTNDVAPAADGFIYRPVGERIRVTITPNP